MASDGFAKTWTQSDAIAEADEKKSNALIFYDAQGNVLASLPPEQDAPAVVVPGTGGEFILRAVCNKG